jgi:hypothetical protein
VGVHGDAAGREFGEGESFQWSVWVWVRTTAEMRSQDAPTDWRRAVRNRGCSPQSMSRPKPSSSSREAFPPLPLASTVNRAVIESCPLSITSAGAPVRTRGEGEIEVRLPARVAV